MIEVGTDFERMREYLAGRLSDEERQAFEDRLVRDPKLVREVEQSVQLAEGLTELRAQGYFAQQRPVAKRTVPKWLPTLAAAAVAGVVIYLAVQGTSPPPPVLTASLDSLRGAVSAPVSAHFTFVATRGSSTPSLDLPQSGVIEFRAAPGAAENAGSYRVTLTRQGENGQPETVGELSAVSMSADGFVHGYADASRLRSGRYVLEVAQATQGAAAPESYAFELRTTAR